MSLPDTINVSIVNELPRIVPPVSTIPLDPGFSPARLDEVREWMLRRIGGAHVRFVWPVENRRTGIVDYVIGPCTYDEMVATFAHLEGEKPVGQKRWR